MCFKLSDTRLVTLFYPSKRVKNQMHFKFKNRRLLMKINYELDFEVKMQSKELKIQHMEISLEEYAHGETGGN